MPSSGQILRRYMVVYGCLWVLVAVPVAVTVAVRDTSGPSASRAASWVVACSSPLEPCGGDFGVDVWDLTRSAHHTRTLPSSLPVATRVPSGLNATADTRPPWSKRQTSTPAMWSFRRRTADAELLVAANLSADPADVDLLLDADWTAASVVLASGDSPLQPSPGLKLGQWESVIWLRARS